jgi:tRNA threonylcarbamoyladenosine biosynthesis protein TsaE
MMEIIRINTLKDIKVAAKQFIHLIGENKVFAFYGEMGTGKTTFIKAICKELGVTENITSPTFALVNEYITKNNGSIYHFDCYRLKNIREAYDFGADEYFFSGNFCFVEWPEKIEELLPPETVNVTIRVLMDESREITINI